MPLLGKKGERAERARARCRDRRVPLTPLARDRGESRDRRQRRCPRCVAAADDRLRERMAWTPCSRLAADAPARRARVGAIEGDDVGDRRACPRVSVPVLSTISVVSRPACSSATALRISTPRLRAATGADDDRGRRGEAKRAGTGDDQHGDGVDQRRRAASPASHHVAPNVSDGDHDDDGNEHARRRDRRAAGSAPSIPAPPRPGARCRRAASRCPTPVGVAASAAPSLVERAGEDARAGRLGHRRAIRRSACSRRRSTRRRAPCRRPGSLSPARTTKRSPATTSRQRNVDRRAVAHDMRDLRLQDAAGPRARRTSRPSRAPPAACRAAPA